MSFPPNLGITNSFIIDSSCLLFQEFPSLLPQLDHICSPFSKHRMNGYSRIKKSAPNRSKSVDFAELSLARSSSTATPNWSKFKSQGTTPVKITTVHNSIPEHEHEHEQEQDGGVGEVFGAILGRKCDLLSDENAVAEQAITTPLQSAAVTRSFSVRRSASLTDGYSRIHHQLQSAEDGDQNGSSRSRCNVKKKGKFFRVFRRLFGL